MLPKSTTRLSLGSLFVVQKFTTARNSGKILLTYCEKSFSVCQKNVATISSSQFHNCCIFYSSNASYFRMRFQILEDTYKRRELQLKEDNDFAVQQLNERIKAVEMEKNEIVATQKERLMMVEKSKETDLERLKSMQKKVRFVHKL